VQEKNKNIEIENSARDAFEINSAYRVALLGLGAAGWKSDIGKEIIGTSHAYSLIRQKSFSLVAGIDKNPVQLDEWKSVFSLPATLSIWEALETFSINMVVITTPIPTLFSYLTTISSEYPDMKIIVEKPVVANREEALALRDVRELSKQNVLVNLPRLFSKEIVELKGISEDRHLIHIFGSYSGDFVNTALHFITMLNFLFDDIKLIRSGDDSSPIIKVYRDSKFVGEIVRNNLIEKSSFSLELIFENLKIKYLDGGELIFIESGKNSYIIENTRSTYQLNVYSYIAEYGFDKACQFAGLTEVSHSIFQMFEIEI
jgi:predicted dehydrogenase